tara:strand:- start:1577 stop:2641 length:1065 start_codon:yes stop_codon:yes gene_type:complete
MLPEDQTYHMRRVAWAHNLTQLPNPCWRFTGSGDRPCDEPLSPLYYWLTLWKYPHVSTRMIYDYWAWSLVDWASPLVYVDSVPQPIELRDGAWVEVMRFAERVTYVGSDGLDYGVWFWVTPGSGVSINIGHAIRFDDKKTATKWAWRNHPSNTSLPCLTEAEHDNCNTHDDLWFAAAARAAGYDSMLVRRKLIKFGHVSGRPSDVIELILAPPHPVPEQASACPAPVEFRRANGSAPCTCNRSAEMLACYEFGGATAGSVTPRPGFGRRQIAITAVGVAGGAGAIAALIGAYVGMVALLRTFRKRGPAETSIHDGVRGGKTAQETAASLPLLGNLTINNRSAADAQRGVRASHV